MAKKSRGRGWRWRAASGVEAAVAEGGNDPAYPGSTVALCSPCLIVMDEPHSLARSGIRVRRVVYIHRPGGRHLSPVPESGGCSCLPYCRVMYTYIRDAGNIAHYRLRDGDIYEYTRDEDGETATPSIISRYCQPIYLWVAAYPRTILSPRPSQLSHPEH